MPRKNKAFGGVSDRKSDSDKVAIKEPVTLSLYQQAMVSVMVEMGGYNRIGLLGAVAPLPAAPPPRKRVLPDRWSFIHVADRTEEAAEIIGRIPASIWPKGYGSAMPAYTYDWQDLVGQAETLELERAQQQRNRVRIPASPDAIARMNQALQWPMQYLPDRSDLARAVWAAAYIAARKVPDKVINEAIEDAYQFTAVPTRKQFYRLRMDGLQAIVAGLTQDKVQVS